MLSSFSAWKASLVIFLNPVLLLQVAWPRESSSSGISSQSLPQPTSVTSESRDVVVGMAGRILRQEEGTVGDSIGAVKGYSSSDRRPAW